MVALVSMMIVGSVSRDDKTILSAKECVDSLVSAGFDIGAFL